MIGLNWNFLRWGSGNESKTIFVGNNDAEIFNPRMITDVVMSFQRFIRLLKLTLKKCFQTTY